VSTNFGVRRDRIERGVKLEKIYEIAWDGPFEWREGLKHCKTHHVLYQLYGSHPLYGPDVLLYLGASHRDIKRRLKTHEKEWIHEEWGDIRIRLGSVREFKTWNAQNAKKGWIKHNRAVIEPIEGLLIYANQPAYNERNKSDAAGAQGIRIFNTGKLGSILPEISHKCFLGD
jgi:hypothetical protein